jgi:acetylornithine deacetylase/succinyl-diaminopimelate desuccinylase-like protein
MAQGTRNRPSLDEAKRFALRKVDEVQKDAVQLLQSMIRIPSYNPPGNEKDLADFTAAFLRKYGMDVQQIEPFDKRVSNIGRLNGAKHHPVLLFNSHLDTLPPGAAENWTYGALSGDLKDGMIWGLGAKNMKSGMAAAMFAVRLLAECDLRLNGDLMITQTADEMQMGLKGLKLVVEQGLVAADYAVYTECDPPLKVETAHRGLVWLDITVHGYSVHTTDYADKKPINAIVKMAKVIPAIAAMQFSNWQVHPQLPGEPVISPNIISGGFVENMHADACTIRCDCRTIPPQTTASVVADVNKVLDELMAADPELKVSVSVYRDADASVIDPTEPIVKAVQAAIKEVTGLDVPSGGVKSTSDSRWLINVAHIPTCKFMFPTVGSETNEREKVEDYLNTIRVYITLILNLLYGG